VPIALAATSGYVRQDYALLGSQPPAVNCTIAAPADSVLIHVGHAYSYYAGTGYSTPTNTGTALTWRFAGYSIKSNSADPNDGLITAVFWAYNANAQTITVSSSQNNSFGAAYDVGHHAQVWAFTGANYSVRNVTNRASTGTTRTLTFAAQGSYFVGETIQVAIGNANYDGIAQITSVSGSSPWTVSYTATGSLSEGTTSASGTVTEWPIPLGEAAGVGPYFSPSDGVTVPLYQPFLAAGSTVFSSGISLSATAPTATTGFTMYTPASSGPSGQAQWRGFAALRADQGPATQFYNNQTVTNPNTRIGFIVHPAPEVGGATHTIAAALATSGTTVTSSASLSRSGSAVQSLSLTQAASGRRNTRASSLHLLDLTQAASGRRNTLASVLQTITLTQSVVETTRVVSTALQPITLTQEASGVRAAFAVSLQTLTLTQQALPTVNLAADSAQLLILTQEVSGRRGVFATAAQSITLTQEASGKRRHVLSAFEVITLTQEATGGVGVRGQADQGITLDQAVVEIIGALRTATQPITLTQAASARLHTFAVSLHPLPLTQAVSAGRSILAVSLHPITLTQAASARLHTFAVSLHPLPLTQEAAGTRDSGGSSTNLLPLTQQVTASVQVAVAAVQILPIAQLASASSISIVVEETLTLTQQIQTIRGTRAVAAVTLEFSQGAISAVVSYRVSALQSVPAAQVTVGYVDLITSAQFLIILTQLARRTEIPLSLLPIPLRPDVIISGQGNAQGGPLDAPNSGGVLISAGQPPE